MGLSLVAMYMLSQLKKRPTLLHLLSVAIFLCALGLFIELAQHATGRGASLGDVILNTAGIVCGCCASVLFLPVVAGRKHWIRKIVLIATSVTAMAWSLQWPVVYAVAGAQRPVLPLLADFENLGASHFISGNGSLQHIAHHAEWTQNDSRSLKVHFLPGRYPNVHFLEPEMNWSYYNRIVFKVFNPGKKPVKISVRIDDSSLGLLDDDHMTVRQIIPSGISEVSLDLNDFRADALRRLRPGFATFKQIKAFMVFVGNNREAINLYFDDFSLK